MAQTALYCALRKKYLQNSPMSDLSYFRSFLAVYRHGSVTRAAEALDVAQPTVTAHVKALEAELGRSLFHRRPRGVEPRAAAHELANVVARHVDVLDGVLFGDTGRAGRGGAIWLGGPSEFLGSVAVPTLTSLIERGIRVRAFADVDEPVLAALREAEIDLAVLTAAHDEEGLEIEVLQDEELVLVASPKRADRIGEIPNGVHGPEYLVDEPIIAYSEEVPLVREYWHAVFRTRWSGSPSIVINSLPAVTSMVRRDLGIAVLPRHVCEHDIERGSLSLLLEPSTPPRNTLYLAYRAGSAFNPVIARTIDLLRGTELSVSNLRQT
jgi:DNA-binding transcriptional LysR family regulator